jgi:epoxyqueuosine reductase
MSFTAALKQAARDLGFGLAGVCPAIRPAGLSEFYRWLEAGYAGQMHYLPDRALAYEHPSHVLQGVRSIVMLAMSYNTAEPTVCQPGEGRVSRYAWGGDYHALIRQRLQRLAEFLQQHQPQAHVRGVVDTAPLLEREFAQLAGLGWVGKNTLLLNTRLGSWCFLAALLTDLELEYDEPHAADHCGTCRACLDACPTGAFVDAYVLDARKCISYATIELRASIPPELREAQGDWLFGCDICQDVCPWNRKAPETSEPAFAPRDAMNPLALADLFHLDDAAFRRRFRDTPLWRTRRRGLLRNAAIVLGNQQAASALEALGRGLFDGEPLVRGASAWALGKIGGPRPNSLLKQRLAEEEEVEVRQEIAAALAVWHNQALC